MAATGIYGYRVEGGGRLEIKGLKEVNRALKSLSAATKNDLKQTHREAGHIVAIAAIRYTPVRTGRLAASIRSNPTQRMGRVAIGNPSTPYAGPIHFGWPNRRIKPQPFVYEALDERRDQVLRVYEQRIDQLIVKYTS